MPDFHPEDCDRSPDSPGPVQSIRHQIDLIADAYEQALQNDSLADWQPFWEQLDRNAGRSDQSTLLVELLQLKLDYTNQQIELVLDDAKNRMPDFELAISSIAPERTQDSPKISASDEAFEKTSLSMPAEESEATFLSATMPERPLPQPGQTVEYVGDYEIISEIARGGMGVVYRARQRSLGRLVALKMILSGDLAGIEEVQRFQAEAEAAARLDHPGIVPIYEVGRHDELQYFSMGLIEGESLSERIKERPIDPTEAAEIAAQVAEAIAYAHANDVVHRDLKPANILLDQEGKPHVTDFGLAKRLESNRELTAAGQVLGTPSYMPPEQARGDLEAIGPPADIYAIGAVLYAMICGRPPHVGATAIDTVRQVVEQTPASVRTLNPSLPKDLETICQKCLEKTPAQRYESAEELAEELRRFLRGEPIKARPISRVERVWRWTRRHPAYAALSAAVVLLAATLAIGGPIAAFEQRRLAAEAQENEQRALDSEQVAKRNEQRAEKLAEQERDARREVDAKRGELAEANSQAEAALYARTVSLAYRQWEDGNLSAADDLLAAAPESLRGFEWDHVRSLLETHTHQYEGLTGLPSVVGLTADGTHVFASSRTAAMTWLWDATDPQPSDVRSERVVAIAPDRRRMAVVRAPEPNSVLIVDIVTGTAEAVLRGHTESVQLGAFSADGTRIATSASDRTVRIWDLERPIEVADEEKGSASPSLLRQLFDGLSGNKEARDTTIPSMTEVGLIDLPFRRQLNPITLSPDGNLIAWRRADDGAVVIRESQTGNMRFEGPAVAALKGRGTPVAFSPDGEVIAFANIGAVEIRSAISGDTLRTLYGLRGKPLAVEFDPAGDYLAVTSEDGVVRLFDASTAEPLTELVAHRTGQIYGIPAVAFGDDSDELITAGADLFVKRWESWSGETPEKVGSRSGRRTQPSASVDYVHPTVNRSQCVAYSPDGKWLATGDRDNQLQVFDVATGELLLEKTGLSDEVNAVVVDREADIVVAGGGGPADAMAGPVWAWRVSDGEELWTYRGTTGPVADLELSVRTGHVAVGVGSAAVQSGRVIVLELEDATEVGAVGVFRGSVADVAFSPDGSELAVVGYSMNGVMVASIETGQTLTTIGDRAFNAVDYSSDGKRLAVGGNEWSVRLFDRESGEQIWSERRHNGAVTAVRFAEEDNRLVSTGVDGAIHVWDTIYGNSVLELEDDGLSKLDLAFSDEAGQIAVAGLTSGVVLRSLGHKKSEVGPEQWPLLLSDDFERDQLGPNWTNAGDRWAIKDGKLVGTLGPMPQLPNVGFASIRHKCPMPANVSISYDVTFDSLMTAETKLAIDDESYFTSGLLVAKAVPYWNFGEAGGVILTNAFGQQREIASRRENVSFETRRTYRYTTVREGPKLTILVDGRPFRSGETSIDMPLPDLMIQGLFGEHGQHIRIDNLEVRAPAGAAAEVVALSGVGNLFAQDQIRPWIVSKLRTGDDVANFKAAEMTVRASGIDLERLDAGLAAPASSADIRRFAIRAAETWPERDTFRKLRALATHNSLSQADFKLLLDWIRQNGAEAEAETRTAALIAYRADDRALAWEYLKQPLQGHRKRHGYGHPLELTLMGLLFARDQPGKAKGWRSRIDEILRAERWSDDETVLSWANELRAAVEGSELGEDAEVLASRIWDVKSALYRGSDTGPLKQLLSESSKVEYARSGDEVGKFTVSAEDWINTQQQWYSGSAYGNEIVRTAVRVLRPNDNNRLPDDQLIIQSDFIEVFDNGFAAVQQSDVFQRSPNRPPIEWPVVRRSFRLKALRIGDRLIDSSTNGWTEIDKEVEDLRTELANAESDDERDGLFIDLIETLIHANRLPEAFEVSVKRTEEFPIADAFSQKVVAAGLAAKPDAMRAAAGKAAELDPLVEGLTYLRAVASRTSRQDEPVDIDGVFSLRPAKFQKSVPPAIIGAGDTGKYASRVSADDLIGLIRSDGQTTSLREIADGIASQRKTLFKSEAVESRPITVTDITGWQVLLRGPGLGWAAAAQGKTTLQRWVLLPVEDSVYIFFASAFEDDFASRDTEFLEMLNTIAQLTPE